jgi:hypothetical protein
MRKTIFVFLVAVLLFSSIGIASAHERLYPITVFEVRTLNDSNGNFWSYDGPSSINSHLHYGFGGGTLLIKEFHYLFTTKQVRDWKAVVKRYGGTWGGWYTKREGSPLYMISSGYLHISTYMKYFHNQLNK